MLESLFLITPEGVKFLRIFLYEEIPYNVNKCFKPFSGISQPKKFFLKVEITYRFSAHENAIKITNMLRSLGYQEKFNSNPCSALGAINFQKKDIFWLDRYNIVILLDDKEHSKARRDSCCIYWENMKNKGCFL